MTFGLIVIVVIAVLAWVLRPGRASTRQRTLSILAVIVPTVLLAVAAVVYQLLYSAGGDAEVSDVSNILFIIGLGIILIAIVLLAVFALKQKGELARGLGFGLCIAVALSIAEVVLLEWLAGG